MGCNVNMHESEGREEEGIDKVGGVSLCNGGIEGRRGGVSEGISGIEGHQGGVAGVLTPVPLDEGQLRFHCGEAVGIK